MRFLCVIAALMSLQTYASEVENQLARDLLAAMDIDQQIEVMAQNLGEMQARQLQQMDIPAEAQPIIEQHLADTMTLLFSTFKQQSVKDKYAQMYVDTFTEQELRDILAFYQSGAGKAFLEKFPQVMAGITQIAESQVQSILPQMMEMNKQLEVKLAKYKSR